MLALADYKTQATRLSGPAAAPATSVAWPPQQQQRHQGQQRAFGVLDLIPDMQTIDTELTMLRQHAQQVTADRLHLQPQLSPLMAPAAPANTAARELSLFGAIPSVTQTERLPKRQWRSSSGSPPPPPPPPRGSPLPMCGEPWLEPSNVNLFANAPPSPPSRPAAKKPRHAGPAAEEAESLHLEEDATQMMTSLAAATQLCLAAATQLCLQQILAELGADQDANPLAAAPGPHCPQLLLTAPGPLAPAHFELVPVAGPSPDPVVPAPVSPAAGPVQPPQAGTNRPSPALRQLALL